MMRISINASVVSKNRSLLFGIGTIFVFLAHSAFIVPMPYMLQVVFGNCAIWGVRMFFFLSAVGLSYSQRKKKYSYKEYIIRRISRIMLPFFCFCIPFYIWQELWISCRPMHFVTKVLLLEYWINGKGNVWYLSVQMVLYILFPVIRSCFRKNGKNAFLFWTGLLTVIAGVIYTINPQYYSTINNTFGSVLAFLLGCFLSDRIIEGKTISWLVILLGLLTFPLSAILFSGTNIFILYSSAVIGVALCFALAQVIEVINFQGLNKVLKLIGDNSLQLYLSNVILIAIAQHYCVAEILKTKGVSYSGIIVYGIIVIICCSLTKLYNRVIKIQGRGENVAK